MATKISKHNNDVINQYAIMHITQISCYKLQG